MEEEVDWICTDDIVHWIADSMAVSDMLEGVQLKVNLSMLTMHLEVSRELHFPYALAGDVEKVHRTQRIVSHSNSCQDQPSCICLKSMINFHYQATENQS